MASTRLLAVVASLGLLGGCSGGGPSEGLEDYLHAVAGAHDEHFEEHGEYPDPFRPSEVMEVVEEEERWNLVSYYGSTYGYCLEGDDEDGQTWHLMRDADEPEKGECPGS